MTNTTLALLLIAAAPAFAASDEDVRKGLQNLQTMQQLAQLAEGALLAGVTPEMPNDPWGTPYRLTVSDGRYTIASAGSDGKFDETAWSKEEQFTGLEGDLVLVDGRMTRSNRNWLSARAAGAMDDLVRAEVHLMMSRNPVMRALELRRATVNMIQMKGAELERDAWGTPVRVIKEGEKTRIVSAGADKTFDPMSWSRPPGADVGEDIVVEDGIPTRIIDDQAVLKAALPVVDPIPQPLDPPFDFDLPGVSGEIKAPVVVKQVEPKYPEIYRRARISGITIVEAAISAKGEVLGARLVKSLAPGIDTAALEAVRQWKFEPATKDGVPVAVLFNLTVNFKLN